MQGQPKWVPWPCQQPDKEQWERDLRFAEKVQSLMLEGQVTSVRGATATAYSVPHYAVGGDYFDVLPSPDGGFRLVVADVMGKGVGPAMLMTMVRSAVRMATPEVASPGALLRRINDLLYEDLQQLGSFVTMGCIDFCPEGMLLQMASAGQPYPLILRRSAGTVERVKVRGVALGMLPDRTYKEEQASVRDGDRLLLYTDGLIEVRSPQGVELGVGGLGEWMLASENLRGPELIRTILGQVADHTQGVGARDDVTLVVVDFDGRIRPEDSERPRR